MALMAATASQHENPAAISSRTRITTSARIIPPPTVAPKIDQRSVTANAVRIQLHEDGALHRRRPSGVASAAIFAYVGTTPPEDPLDWVWQGNTSRTEAIVGFDASLPMGTKVWITAAWANERGQTGPASSPLGATLLGTGALPSVSQSGGTLSLAA